jgi:hypothetical protein
MRGSIIDEQIHDYSSVKRTMKSLNLETFFKCNICFMEAYQSRDDVIDIVSKKSCLFTQKA